MIGLIGVFVQVAAVSGLSADLQALSALQGQAYINARDVALQAHTPEQLDRFLGQAHWDASDVELAAMAAVLQAHHQTPELFVAVRDIDGLNPARYLKRRRKGPEASTALLRRQPFAGEKNTVWVAFELLRLQDALPISAASDFPTSYSSQAMRQWQDAEREAIIDAALVAVGTSGHPVAVPTLTKWLREATLHAQKSAAMGLGLTHKPEAVSLLAGCALDDGYANDLRASCASALGHIRTQGSLNALRALRGQQLPIDVRRAAVMGIGILGSPSANRDVGFASMLRQDISQLVQTLADPSQEALASAATRVLAILRKPQSVQELQGARQAATNLRVIGNLDRALRLVRRRLR